MSGIWDNYEALYRQKEATPMQKKAWKRWQEKGVPTRSSEAFRYVSLKRLEGMTPCFDHKSQFEYLAPPSIVLLPLNEARQRYGLLLEKRCHLFLQKEKDPFFFLNWAVGEEGLFLYVPPKVQLEQPLYLFQKISSPPALSCPHFHPQIEIFLGKGASLTVIFEVESQAKHFWNNVAISVTLEEGASYFHLDQRGRKGAKGCDFLSFQAELKERSSLKFFSFGRGGEIERKDLTLSLEGEGATADLRGVLLLKDHLEGHVHVRVDHLAPHTSSNQLFKHVVAERSRCSFEGKIFVDKEAQKTQAYQMSRSLILDEGALAFSKPNLEIFADDVKASHGATVSQPRLEELFYLRCRGLSEKEAKCHLIEGFCSEGLGTLPSPFQGDQLKRQIHDFLSPSLSSL